MNDNAGTMIKPPPKPSNEPSIPAIRLTTVSIIAINSSNIHISRYTINKLKLALATMTIPLFSRITYWIIFCIVRFSMLAITIA